MKSRGSFVYLASLISQKREQINLNNILFLINNTLNTFLLMVESASEIFYIKKQKQIQCHTDGIEPSALGESLHHWAINAP